MIFKTRYIGTILQCVFFVTLALKFNQGYADDLIKKPNVAGAFYSDETNKLSAHIDFLKHAAIDVPTDRRVEVVIAPHAGYVYSGSVAAFAFKAIARNQYKTVVVIAPSHFFRFEGIAVWPKGGFQTPLGTVPVDETFAGALLKENSKFQILPHVFEQEHAIEVELPFLQKTFGEGVSIVPILMGQPDFKICLALARALDKIMGSRQDVLVLISSDLSHYHPYDFANHMDGATLETIAQLDPGKLYNGCLSGEMEMCGFLPVTTGIILAQFRGLRRVEILKYANSGDTAGDKSKVVGYASVIFYASLLKDAKPREAKGGGGLTAEQKKQLLTIARTSIESFVKTGKTSPLVTPEARLNEEEGAFVTIHKNGQLRGCIGNIIGQQPLAQTVRDMAVAAASQDPRFSPVTVDELSQINIEISVLSKPKRVSDLAEIELGRDGVIISDGGAHQGVFLPQVADETGWSKEEFLSQLSSQKAGLSPKAWQDPKNLLFTFTADVFAE